VRLLIVLLAGLFTLGAEAWLLLKPDWEPALTMLGGFIVYLGAVYERAQHSTTPRARQAQPSAVEIAAQSVVNHSEPVPSDPTILRFRELFQAHGILLNQIPRVLPSRFRVTVAEVKGGGILLSRADWPEILTWTAEFFGVRLSWLEAEDNRIYQPIHGYKEGIAVLRRLLDLRASSPSVRVYAFRSHRLTSEGPDNSDVGLLFMAEIERINERPIYRYIPVTEWRWDYWRSRDEFKTVVYALTQLGMTPGGWDLDPGDLRSLCNGYAFPEIVLEKARKVSHGSFSWFPDAYIPPNATEDPVGAERILEEFDQSRWRSLLAMHAEEKNLWYRLGHSAEFWLRTAPPYAV
jgi:hypothetical protein